MIFRMPSSFRIFAWTALVLFAIVAILPIAAVFAQSFFSDGHLSLHAYRSVLANSRQWGLLRNTLTIAIGAALAATLLGVPIALAIDRTHGRTRTTLEWTAAFPLLLPPYLSAAAWMDLLGLMGLFRVQMDGAAQNNAYGTIFSNSAVLPPAMSLCAIASLAFSFFPIVTLMLSAALRNYDERLEEPALLVGGTRQASRSIKWPLLAPHAVAAALIVFVLALVEFAVPSLLQVNVYTVEIFARFSTTYDAGSAAAQSLPLILLGLLPAIAYLIFIRPRRRWLSGRPRSKHCQEPCSPARRVLTSVSWVFLIIAIVAPLAFLFFRSLPLSSYIEVWKTARDEILSSLLLAAISATALTVLAAAMTLAAHAHSPGARLYALSAIPFLASGPLLGIGLIWIWNRPGPFAMVYDTPAVLVLACTARFLFFAYYGIHAATRSLPRRFEEAAAVSAVSWWRYVTGILFPLSAPALAAVWGLAFVFSFRELDAAVLVAPPGWNPLAVRMFSLLHYGPSAFVAALGVIAFVMILAAAAATLVLYNQAKRIAHVGH